MITEKQIKNELLKDIDPLTEKEFKYLKERLNCPKKEKDPPTMYLSVTPITLNYELINFSIKLKQFSDLGVKLFIVVLDPFMYFNPLFKRELNDDMTVSELLDKKIDEYKRLLISFGVNEKNTHIVKFSDAWEKFVEKGMLMEYNKITSRLNIKDRIKGRWTLNHAITLAGDFFLANFYHLIYPEETKRSADFFYLSQRRRSLDDYLKKLVLEEGIISREKPVCLYTKKFRLSDHKGLMPSLDMKYDEIYDILTQEKLTKEKINYLYNSIFKKILKDIKIKNNKTSIAQDFVKYFNKIKNKMGHKDSIPRIRLIKSSKEIKEISSSLRSQNVLEILKLCNGENSIVKIAESLKIKVPNVSRYLKDMERSKIIRFNKSYCPEKIVNQIKIDLEKISKNN